MNILIGREIFTLCYSFLLSSIIYEGFKRTVYASFQLANDILVFLIGITYSVISPVIIPVILIHFGYRYIIWVYQLHYVYVQKIDLGGKLWPRVSSRCVVFLV